VTSRDDGLGGAGVDERHSRHCAVRAAARPDRKRGVRPRRAIEAIAGGDEMPSCGSASLPACVPTRQREEPHGGSIRLPVRLALAVAVAVAIAATQAQANRSVSVSFDGHIRGLATYLSEGDWMKICDRRQDGLPVIIRFSYIKKNGQR
jgi:hypothetical protein